MTRILKKKKYTQQSKPFKESNLHMYLSPFLMAGTV